MKRRTLTILWFAILLVSSLAVQPVHAEEAIVHAVLFFSPTCPGCHQVMEVDLPPIAAKYQGKLDIVGIDTSQEVGLKLYQAMISYYNLPDDRLGVPALVIGDQVLVGKLEIPARLPALIEEGLKQGGVAWPVFPGLKEVLSAQGETSPSAAQPPENASGQPAFVRRFNQDPIANGIAVAVLLGMIVSVVSVGYTFIKDSEGAFIVWPNWTISVLALIGIAIALYLSYVEVSRSEAICGPVGDCNSVQESPYARLFGVLPIGVLGMLGYSAILIIWMMREYGPEAFEKFFSLAIWGLSMFGVLFSIYLTYLEPFVIGATCAWCIGSAIVITLLLLASTDMAKQALESGGEYEEDEELEERDDRGQYMEVANAIEEVNATENAQVISEAEIASEVGIASEPNAVEGSTS